MSDAPEHSSPERLHWFTTTHWSVVVAASQDTAPGAHEALARHVRSFQAAAKPGPGPKK